MDEEAGDGTRASAPGAPDAMVDVSFEVRALRSDGTPAMPSGGVDEKALGLWLGRHSEGSASGPPRGSVDHGLRLWFAHRLVASLRGNTSVTDDGACCAFSIPFELPAKRLPPQLTEPSTWKCHDSA